MMMKYLSILTITMSITVTGLAYISISKQKSMMMEWTMMKFSSTNLSATLMMDTKSSLFAACVMLITGAIIMYSSYYMEKSKKKTQFTKLIMTFILSMMTLIFSPNMVTMIMGWEGLGMTSFILIMHYQNSKSINSSFYTMIMNRMGDIMMMMSMTNMMNTNSWTFQSTLFKMQMMMTSMMMVAAFSKSAQIPFSSWLTEAMAAPTPISALVHSSTLVTAGVFLFIRFESILKYSKMMTTILMISMTTLIMASMNSTKEWDIKKIVALSTLSQISIMFITISMNLFNMAMFHLLVHATFKALIFLCSSSMISLSNTQDIRKINKLTKNMLITKMSFNTASMSLSGFPFMSSFYSKEMIMEMNTVMKTNMIMSTTFYVCMFTTLFYSIKTMVFINSNMPSQALTPLKENLKKKTSKVILLMPSVVYGNKLNWIMNVNYTLPHLTVTTKTAPIMTIVMMVMTVKKLYKMEQFMKMKTSDKKMMISYMWFMKNMSIQMKKTALTKFQTIMKNSEKTTFYKVNKNMKTTISKMSTTNFLASHKTTKKMNTMITVIMMTVV